MSVESAWNMSPVNDVKPKPPEMERQDPPVLPAREDEFEGVTVEMNKDCALSPEAFAVLLRNSMSLWKRQGKHGVWIKFSRGAERLHEVAAREGFENHHTQQDYLMMALWIPKNTPCTLPGGATHRVTIGAIVLNDRTKEVLVVQEKWKFHGIWKIPTGTVNEGENTHVAAVREVKEETGIDAEFLKILSVKELHNALFSWSELTFICAMRPTSFDIQMEESEIDAAEWMPMEEFAAQRFAREDEVCRHVVELCLMMLGGVCSGLTARGVMSVLDNKPCMMYRNVQDVNDSEAPAGLQ
ncbi:hypothetical protein MLD38_034291 [Melastoma candidum]|uniref:Uncharacterized protein n=1 Tax=Melastoma candidum TaxID=119954 RepID=A0ACB9MAU5_9MYRT|nr:hypothetical protein MLD38_034291 [Melastoma candidum]